MISRIFRKLIVYVRIFYFKIKYKKHLKLNGKLTFRSGFNILISKGANLEIGSHCFFNNYCAINCLKYISIGNDCIFGENVKIYDHNHVFNKEGLIRENGYNCSSIIIGNNCWIGSNVVILKGVHIGNNCVLGAGTVVSQDIKDNSLVLANRELFIEQIRKK